MVRIFILIASILLSFSTNAKAQSNIKVSISQSEKSGFIKLNIANNSNKKLYLHRSTSCKRGVIFADNFEITLADNIENKVLFKSTSVNYPKNSMITLASQQKIQCMVYLPSFYDFPANGQYEIAFNLPIPAHKQQTESDILSNKIIYDFEGK